MATREAMAAKTSALLNMGPDWTIMVKDCRRSSAKGTKKEEERRGKMANNCQHQDPKTMNENGPSRIGSNMKGELSSSLRPCISRVPKLV